MALQHLQGEKTTIKKNKYNIMALFLKKITLPLHAVIFPYKRLHYMKTKQQFK